MKKRFIIIWSIVLLFVCLVASAVLYVRSQFMPVASDETDEVVRVEIPYGITVSEVGDLLEEKGLIKNSKFFYYSVRFPKILDVFLPNQNKDNNFELKSGIYHVKKNLNVVEVQKSLSENVTEFAKLSIPEGLTITLVGKMLEENNVCSKDDFVAICKDPEVVAKYGIVGRTLEGYLFPDTYFFNFNMDPHVVVDTMVKNFFEKVKTVKNLDNVTPEELSKIINLASIVEKEYKVPDEAPLIASVFINRLEENIGLYSCATIIYILTEIQGKEHPNKVLLEDTKIDNPYNTYMWAGLPPGPISNPGLIAIDAAVNAPKTDYYYFQVVDQEAGRHSFTKTFHEHVENHIIPVK